MDNRERSIPSKGFVNVERDLPLTSASTSTTPTLQLVEASTPKPPVLERVLGKFGLLRDAPLLQPSYEMGVERRLVARSPEDAYTDDGPADASTRLIPGDDDIASSPATPIVLTGRSQADQFLKPTSDLNWCRIGTLLGLTLVPFALLLYGAVSVSQKPIAESTAPLKHFNGSSWFADTTLLISLDGFRADFLHRGLTPTLNSFVRQGISPRWMYPSFPSLTFPNHWTLATGLHPETHGIVANSFWDPSLAQKFGGGSASNFLSPKWWLGEPIWATAEKAGLRTAVHMWPGSEVPHQIEPAYIDKFDGHEKLSRKVDRVLGLLDLPGRNDTHPVKNHPRPQFIAAYVPNVDSDGHLYGPNSTEIHETIEDVDTMLGSIFHGLEARNLTNIVNVIVVSDHGMATTSVNRLIQIDDIIDMSLIKTIDGWPHYGLRPKNPSDLEPLYDKLKTAASTTPGFDVHLRDRDMPSRYHFSANPRIAPLWVMPHPGWAIVTRGPHEENLDAAVAQQEGQVLHPRGIHGYDNEHPLMRSIFIARGPAFPHPGGSRIDEFHNTEVYNIVCDSLGIEPVANNGTLRLPLTALGEHDTIPPGEMLDDFTA